MVNMDRGMGVEGDQDMDEEMNKKIKIVIIRNRWKDIFVILTVEA